MSNDMTHIEALAAVSQSILSMAERKMTPTYFGYATNDSGAWEIMAIYRVPGEPKHEEWTGETFPAGRKGGNACSVRVGQMNVEIAIARGLMTKEQGIQ